MHEVGPYNLSFSNGPKLTIPRELEVLASESAFLQAWHALQAEYEDLRLGERIVDPDRVTGLELELRWFEDEQTPDRLGQEYCRVFHARIDDMLKNLAAMHAMVLPGS
jgi:hypothetical protein